MRKVFTNCYEMDRRCYEEYGLTEDILMEHAAEGIQSYIRHNLQDASSIMIVSGPGNNGADGIALARLMQFEFGSVKLYMPFGVKSEMAKLQLKRVELLDYVEIVDELSDADVVVDALFGSGLSRALDETTQDIINGMNGLNGFKIACDIPTGIDERGYVANEVFDADVTITMGALKEALYSDMSKDFIGDVVRVDLGLRYNYYTKGSIPSSYLLSKEDMSLPSRDFSQVTHKGSFGHAVVLCGEKEGAGIMTAMCATRFGAGLTTVVSHEKINVPSYLMHSSEVPMGATAIAVGMGLGHFMDDEFLFKSVVDSHLCVLLDADSFYNARLLRVLEEKEREIVLTPHPKEFTVLWKMVTGEEISVADVQADRFGMVRKFASLYPHITLLLKGANMIIAQGDKTYINPYGSSKLSKGGSGDVLSGLIVALLAQGYSSIDAAIQGSLALTEAASRYEGSSYAMLPTDLIELVATLENR